MWVYANIIHVSPLAIVKKTSYSDLIIDFDFILGTYFLPTYIKSTSVT
jgi:hypothetical protein